MSPLVTPTTVAVSQPFVFALGSILILLGLLVARELTSNMTDRWAQRVQAALDISVVPLLIVFSMVAMTAIIQALG